MSEVNSAIHGLYRRKVTLACGSCRKRRVKCSGNQPCALCSENGRHCEFDSKNRARRGPRPRQSISQTPRITHPLAPRLPPGSDPADPTWNPPEERQIQVVVVEEAERRLDEVVGGDDEGDGVEVDDAVDDGFNDGADSTDGEEDDVPDPLTWRPGLEDLLCRRNAMAKSLPVLDMDLVCHLLHMFCTRATAQLRLLMPPAQIQHHLSRGTMSRAFVLAMCVSGMRFSVHKAARGAEAQGLAEMMEREALSGLRPSKVAWQQVDTVKTVCVLVDYDASRSHGREAWVNIAMGQSLAQLARSSCDLDAEQAHALDIAERYLGIAQASHSLGHRHLQPRLKPSKRPRLECGPCPEDCPHLIELLEIFGSVHRLYQTPFQEQNPPPWAANSEFRALQDELEEYLLRHPVTFRFGSNSPPSDSDARKRRRGDLDASISSLVWHCCAIALNRAFLLVPERPPRSGPTPREQQDQLASVDQFPDAPSLFLRERIHRCESSADAICSISRDVIKNGGFYSHAVLVSFACAQSALVSVTRLPRVSKPQNERIVGNLKLACIVLGAVSAFYAPAKDWMDVILRAHNTINAPVGQGPGLILDLEQPLFMRLDPKEQDSFNHATDDNDSGGEIIVAVPGGTPAPPPDQPAGSNPSSVWLQVYTDHLSGDIDADDMDADDPPPSDHPPTIPPLHHQPEQHHLPQPAMMHNMIPHLLSAPTPSVSHTHHHGPPSFSFEFPPTMVPDDFPVHMAGAILTSMSVGGTPNMLATEHVDSHLQDVFGDLIGQMPGFEMPATPGSMFLGLGADAGGLWADVFGR